MPNILYRPMFRKGGSVVYGSGITSNLEERKKYKNGPSINDIYGVGLTGRDPIDPNKEAKELTNIDQFIKPGVYDPELYAKSQQQKETVDPRVADIASQMGIMGTIARGMKPTGEQVLADTMAAIASTAPDDPTKLQTFGSFLGKAGAAARGLEKKREEGLQQFKKEAGLQILKNITQDEKDQLFRYAKKYAETKGIPVEQAYQIFLDRYLKGTPAKGLDYRVRELNLYDELTKPRSAGGAYAYSNIQAANIARVQSAIEQSGGKIPPANYGPKSGDYTEVQPGRYIDPDTGTIITWDGKTKTQVWPSK